MIKSAKSREIIGRVQADLSHRNETYEDVADWLIDRHGDELRVGLTMLEIRDRVENAIDGKIPRGGMSEWNMRDALEGKLAYRRVWRGGEQRRVYVLQSGKSADVVPIDRANQSKTGAIPARIDRLYAASERSAPDDPLDNIEGKV